MLETVRAAERTCRGTVGRIVEEQSSARLRGELGASSQTLRLRHVHRPRASRRRLLRQCQQRLHLCQQPTTHLRILFFGRRFWRDLPRPEDADGVVVHLPRLLAAARMFDASAIPPTRGIARDWQQARHPERRLPSPSPSPSPSPPPSPPRRSAQWRRPGRLERLVWQRARRGEEGRESTTCCGGSRESTVCAVAVDPKPLWRYQLRRRRRRRRRQRRRRRRRGREGGLPGSGGACRRRVQLWHGGESRCARMPTDETTASLSAGRGKGAGRRGFKVGAVVARAMRTNEEGSGRAQRNRRRCRRHWPKRWPSGGGRRKRSRRAPRLARSHPNRRRRAAPRHAAAQHAQPPRGRGREVRSRSAARGLRSSEGPPPSGRRRAGCSPPARARRRNRSGPPLQAPRDGGSRVETPTVRAA